MPATLVKRSAICLPPLLLYTADVTITLLHQTPEYWDGNFAEVREGNPFFRVMLAEHVGWFLAFVLCWGMAFTAILLLWRHPLAKVMAFVLTLGHALGTGSWLIGHGTIGWVTAIALLIVSERLLTWSWQRSGVAMRAGEPGA